MASPLGHSMMGVAIYMATVRPADWLKRWGWLFLLILFCAAADFDYLPAAFGRLDLAEKFHRKFTHTFLFAASAALIYLIAGGIIRRKILWKSALILVAAMVIHLGIDIVSLDTKEPRGIAPFEPFSDIRLYSPVILFPNIQKGSYADIVSIHNTKVAVFEIAFFGAIILVAGGLSFALRRGRK